MQDDQPTHEDGDEQRTMSTLEGFLDVMWEFVGPDLHDRLILPSHGETVAIAPGAEKLAALGFDRVWAPHDALVPRSLRCFGDTRYEQALACVVHPYVKDKMRAEKMLTSLRKTQSCSQEQYDAVEQVLLEIGEQINPVIREFGDWNSRFACRSFWEHHHVQMTPVYTSERSRDREFEHGSREVAVASLSGLGIVDQGCLDWEQVIEFRSDEEACRNYRRFLHWLSGQMVGKSRTYIETEIGQRLDDYEAALRKHGIKTVVGMVIRTLTIAAGTVLSDSLLGVVLGTGLNVANLAVSVVKANLDLDDIQRGPSSEVAWVYSVKDLGDQTRS